MPTKIHLVSLGCPKNRVDSEHALWALHSAGAQFAADAREADALLVNTCGFIGEAREESIDTILELAKIKEENPSVKLAVMGCLSERWRDELAREIPEIDCLFGVADLEQVVAALAPAPGRVSIPDPDEAPRILTTAPHWAYLKIAEGCSNTCSFCVIPNIRGPYRSRTPEKILEEAQNLAGRGVRELILVAQDTTLYGADLKREAGLARLLEQLNGVGALAWLRVLYLYPPLVGDRLLEAFAALDKVAPYFDIPLQHASDRVLKRMRRPETNESVRRLAGRVREKVPGAALRTSFIVGFPGETEEDFQALLDLATDVRFDHLGAFVYSPEEGSAACGSPDPVDEAVARERLDRLLTIQRKISAELQREKIGGVREVMVDGCDPDETLLTARLKTQAPQIDGSVILDGVAARPGDIIPVRITGSMDYDLIGVAAGARENAGAPSR